MPTALFRYAFVAMYAVLVVLITPMLSIDYQARTLISVSELIARHRPLSRYLAGCAAWVLCLALTEEGHGWLPYVCWLSAHGIVTFDADTHLRAHLAFLALFCVLLLATTTAAAASSVTLAATTLAFLALLAINVSCCDWRFGQQQNVLELVWLGALCWWVVSDA